MDIFGIIFLVLFLVQPVIIFLLYRKNKSLKSELLLSQGKVKDLEEKFGPLIDLDEQAKILEQKLKDYEINIENLKGKYSKGLSRYELLKKDLSLFEESNEMHEYGAYMPYFDFDTSEKFKTAIKLTKNRQRDLIKNKDAAICTTEWSVGNSRREGQVMTNKAIKLTLRAFNGDCDALITKVKWNNIQNIEQRILKSFDAINKANDSNKIIIQDRYLNLKLDEARLTHEFNLKRHEEKEEQRAIREEMREEERANREIEKAKKDAEKEEQRYEKALQKAREDLGKVQGSKLEKLNLKIASLQEALENAHTVKERAIARAQITKSGHVYVISNLGSFGENIFKIGMTRRLEPLDRVKELGDASVPFQFDIHAMIYSENAPSLEAELHRKFTHKRVNRINFRKEYFAITIDEVEEAINEISDAEIEIMKIAEAHEYRESLSLELAEEKKANRIEKLKVLKHSSDTLFD